MAKNRYLNDGHMAFVDFLASFEDRENPSREACDPVLVSPAVGVRNIVYEIISTADEAFRKDFCEAATAFIAVAADAGSVLLAADFRSELMRLHKRACSSNTALANRPIISG
jgi:hypothetical protein